ncbi:LuxR C-terminal-related transcriptional regulator [Arthrobacter sp. TMS1-12-1]
MESRTHAFIGTDTPALAAPTAGSPGEQAFFAVRTDLIDAVLERIQGPGHGGAVLRGEEGSGKTAILRAVAHRASRTHHVVRIWASRRASAEPYRAIAFLLAELESGDTHHPLTIIQGVRALLEEQSAGRPVLLAIDNAAYLDAESALVVSRLVVAGTASLLIAAESLRTVDASFSDLWRDGDLECFDLPRLGRQQIRAIAEAALGAPVSPDGVALLESSSEGNARNLCSALEDLPQQGITLRGGAWVAASDRLLVPSAVRDSARSTLAALHECEQRVVLALAFAGSLPMAAVRHLAGGPDTPPDPPSHESWRATTGTGAEAAHLDALQPLIVTGGSGGASMVSLRSALFAAAIREQTRSEEAAALHTLLLGASGRAVDPAAVEPAVLDPAELDPVLHADWLLAAGLAVPADLSLAAARRCALLGLHGRALFWASRHSDDGPEHLLVAASAALALGHGEEAEALLAQGPVAPDGASVPVQVALLLLRSRASRLTGGPAATRTALLDDADGLLVRAERRSGASGRPDRQLLACRGDVTVERAEDAAFDGDYPAVLRLLQGTDRTGWTPDQEVLGDGLLCEALALTDQQLSAVGLARGLRARREASTSSRWVHDVTRLRIAVARYAAGSAERAGAGGPDTVAGSSSGPTAAARAGVSASGPDMLQDLVTGVGAVLQGRPAEARALLLPVARQLELLDPYGLLPLASVVLTGSDGPVGAGEGPVALPRVRAARPSSWLVTAVAGHLRAVSAGPRDPRAETSARLDRLAQAAESRGASLLAMTHRLAEVRSGDTRAATSLASAAARIEGAYADACELYAKAVGASDAELFAQAMEGAARAGDSGLSRECAAQALQTAQLSGARGVLRDIQRRARGLFGDTSDLELGAALERLTRREREVAQLVAAGQNNRDIALAIGVTTRTVEGHLYQIFSKLHLSARSELADLVPAGGR